MKVLRVIDTLNPATGGPAATLGPISAALARLGHTVEVACLDSPDAPWLGDPPFRVHCLGPNRARFGYSRELGDFLQANLADYDCVIVHGIWGTVDHTVWKCARRSRTPYVICVHGMLAPWFNRRYPRKYLKKLVYWLLAEYRILRDAGAVLYCSEQERLLAARSFWPYRCRDVIVDYGTAPPAGDAAAQARTFLERFPQLEGKRIITFLGRIHQTKGCDLLVEAFARIRRQGADVHLVMAGPDEVGWQESLAARARELGVDEHITWTGLAVGDLKWGVLRVSEVFVLPSHQDNHSVAMVEALACGVPVLISNQVYVWPEIVRDGAGFAGPDTVAGTHDLLAAWFALSGRQQARMRRRARQTFESRFDAAIAARSLANVIEAAGSHSPGARDAR